MTRQATKKRAPPPSASDVAVPPIEDHDNQFGVVRLGLASLVILSHSFPLAQGFDSVEPLQRLTGTTTLGELSVCFFFVISGYLVSESFARSRSIISYLGKRLRRVYPGFVIALVVSLTLALACGGRWRVLHDSVHVLVSLTTLQQPILATAFAGNPYEIVNGSLWTIRYEFACYLLPVTFLVLGLHKRILVIVCLSMALILVGDIFPRSSGTLIAPLHNALRLSGTFMAGMAFRPILALRPPSPLTILVATAAFALTLFWGLSSGLGIAYPGGYALLALCHHRGRTVLSRIGRRNDLSYGVYLYGWPVQSLVVWLQRGIAPWQVFFLSMPIALVFGWASWHLVEKPFLHRRLRESTPDLQELRNDPLKAL